MAKSTKKRRTDDGATPAPDATDRASGPRLGKSFWTPWIQPKGSIKARPRHDCAYKPRALSRYESAQGDLYCTFSPKAGRVVEIVTSEGFDRYLALEFDPRVQAFAERPRRMPFNDHISLEFDFFVHDALGEHFEIHANRIAHLPDTNEVLRIAASLDLKLIVIAASAEDGPQVRYNRLAMLPYVQFARRMPQLMTVRDAILPLVRDDPGATFERVERALQALHPYHVRAATCTLVHAGVLSIDWTKPLHGGTRLKECSP